MGSLRQESSLLSELHPAKPIFMCECMYRCIHVCMYVFLHPPSRLKTLIFVECVIAKDGWRGEKGEESPPKGLEGDRDTPQRGALRVSARLPSSGPGHHPWTTRRTFPVVSDPNSHRWGGVACYKEPKNKSTRPSTEGPLCLFLLEQRRGGGEERECVRERERQRKRGRQRERETQKL